MLTLLLLLSGFVIGLLAKSALAFFRKTSHTDTMPPQGQPQQQGNIPANLNWPAIHAAFGNHVAQNGQPVQPGQQPQAQVGGTQQPGPAQPGAQPMPQPAVNQPGYAMLIHAMATTPKNPGEDAETMILRALEGHLKRITPDVSSIHKDAQKPATGGGAY